MSIGDQHKWLDGVVARIDNEDIPDLRKEISTVGITFSEAIKILSERISDNHDLIERTTGAIETLSGIIVNLSSRLDKLESAAGSRPPVDIG